MLKVGLVGVGGVTHAHIPAWEAMPETDLVAMCDIRQCQLDKYPEKRHYHSLDEMLEKEDLDILDVCLPSYLHADAAVKALEKGIHVISEKPISLKEEDVKRVYDAAHKNNVNFMVAHVLRFWPEYELVRQLYENGKYGKLLSGYMRRLGTIPKWSWDNWFTDKARSGLVPYDLHVHDLDFMIYAFGEPTKFHTHRSERPDQDAISATYEYPDFFITAEASWYASPFPFTAAFRFQFEHAVVTADDGKCMIYEESGNAIDVFGSKEDSFDAGDVALPQSDAYFNEIRYFTDCVLEGRFPDKIQPNQLETVIRILNSM